MAGAIKSPNEIASIDDSDLIETRTPSTNFEQYSGFPIYSHFTNPTKRWIVFLVALAGFFSPLSANIYFPALNYIATELSVSLELMNLTITAYLVCQGVVPFIIGGLADSHGRRPLYLIVFTVYFAANVGLAVQTSYPALLLLRILQSSGSSGKLSIQSCIACLSTSVQVQLLLQSVWYQTLPHLINVAYTLELHCVGRSSFNIPLALSDSSTFISYELATHGSISRITRSSRCVKKLAADLS